MRNSKTYYTIKDHCRKGLLKYLSKAIAALPAIESPSILEAGCGSGVPTLALAEHFQSHITAIDIDATAIKRLEEKVKKLSLSDRITPLNCSLFDMDPEENRFDLIVAEGLLNVVGFEKGFLKVIELVKSNGFFIIHDEYRDHNKKIAFIESNHCKLLDLFKLDEQVWWNDYYDCLQKEISAQKDKDLLSLIKSDIKEIELFRRDPSAFTSAYYMIEKK